MLPPRRRAAWAATTALAAACLAAPAGAQVSRTDVFRNTEYTQTGSATTTTPLFFFASRVFETNPGDITSATLTYPGPGSPVNLTNSGGTVFLYQTGFFTPLAAFNAAYPTGTYTDNWGGGTAGTGSTSINDTGDFYSNAPLLTAGTYGALTSPPGLNAAASNTLSWNPFMPNGAANENDIFLTITNAATNANVFSSGLLPSSATSATVAAGTLAPATAYNLQLDFSSRINGTSGGVTTTQGFDQRVDVSFQTAPRITAVPEPSTLLLFTVAGLGLAGRRTLRARRRGA